MRTVLAFSRQVQIAAWVPGWYNLDQSIVVGETDDFVLFAELPDLPEIEWLERRPDLVFFNTLMHPGEWVRRRLQVISIRHHQLGDLAAIRTDRFGVYEFTAAGRTYEVEAEEGPGICYDNSIGISDWGVLVEVMEQIAPADPFVR